MARTIARSAAGLASAVDAEVWGSELLGSFWRARGEMGLTEAADMDAALELGTPLLEQLARIDDLGAAIATLALAELDDGELGLQAKELLDAANMWRRLPAWASDVGEGQIVGAAVMRDAVFDDARTVLLESRHADGRRLAVGVLIDNNLGRMAKDVLLADSIEDVERIVREQPAEDGIEVFVERIAPGQAAGVIGEAIRLTDMTWNPPVDEDYWGGRAIALLHADQTPGAVGPAEPTEMTTAEREALRDAFLASPHGASFAPDSEEAWIAAVAIEFADGYLGNDPLRWSPSVVELFMLDWVPRKVQTTEAMLAVLPAALDGWVRFAADRWGVPERALAMTREAIESFATDMPDAVADAARANPAVQLLRAIEGDDVDLGDAASDTVLQVKVSLKGVSKPPVWRRLQLPAGTGLDELHQIIQTAFGWQDYHLHGFEAGGEEFGPADPDTELDADVVDESDATLGELASQVGDRIEYTYDFGDNWRHEIAVENVLDRLPGIGYPVLVTAKGACPPEDCGGVWGYEELKDALANPDSERHDELREWLGLAPGERFDPAAIDADALGAALAPFRHA